MRNLFLIKHHPRRLPEAYQENSRRTRAPRHTLPACAGRYDDESVISLRQRVVNVMPSECRVGSQKREVFETVRKAVPVTFLFLSYMEPLFYVSRGKTGGRGTGKT